MMDSDPNDAPSLKSGRDLLGLIIKSLLRAGVKSVPLAGAGIDQATFGIEDALANAELREAVEAILLELRTLSNEIKNERFDSKEITSRLLERPALQDLIRRLDTASASTLRDLSTLLRQLGAASRTLRTSATDLRSIAESIGDQESMIMSEIRERSSSTDTQLRETRERLEHVIRILEREAHLRPPLSQIVKQLEMIDPEPLVLSAGVIRDAQETSISDEVQLTVDFSEIHRYAFAYSKRCAPDDRAPFAIYIFQKPRRPLYLLPATCHEMARFLRWAFNRFAEPVTLSEELAAWVNERREKEPELLAAEFAAPIRSPLQRVKRLLSEGHIARWHDRIPSWDDLEPYRQAAWQALDAERPDGYPHSHALRVDVENLATVAYLNDRGATPDQWVTHVSTDRKLLRAQHYARRNRPHDSSAPRVPLILHTRTLAFKDYLPHQTRLARIMGDINQVESLPVLRERWICTLKSGTLTDMATLTRELQLAHGSLCNVTEMTASFHSSLLDAELADIGSKTAGLRELEASFDDAQERILDTITDLLSYVEPVEKAFAPFLAYRDQER